jgi:uncharacterized protein with PQ loop repeat
MSQRNFHKIALACAALISLLVFLPGAFDIVTSPGIAWATLILVATVGVGFISYLVYLVVCMEVGYDPEEEKSKWMHKPSSHARHPLKVWLHMRTLRHH